jgi:hypothetical protein
VVKAKLTARANLSVLKMRKERIEVRVRKEFETADLFHQGFRG